MRLLIPKTPKPQEVGWIKFVCRLLLRNKTSRMETTPAESHADPTPNEQPAQVDGPGDDTTT